MSKFFIQTQLELVQATGRPAAERLPFIYVKGAGTQHRRAGGSVVGRSGSSERINKVGTRRRLVEFSLGPCTYARCGESGCLFLVQVLGAIEQRIKEASVRFHYVHFDGERIRLDGQRSQDKNVTAVTARLRITCASTASQQGLHTVIRVSAALSAVAHHQDAARALHDLRLSHNLQQQVMICVRCLWLCLQQKVQKLGPCVVHRISNVTHKQSNNGLRSSSQRALLVTLFVLRTKKGRVVRSSSNALSVNANFISLQIFPHL
mmetsp:Transcript_10760/g.18865  ORF Transcript_10760/g.18865 Transcript_10760/m.18865 type:complete len:263 (-) Transcript_10760:1478-2266(-)